MNIDYAKCKIVLRNVVVDKLHGAVKANDRGKYTVRVRIDNEDKANLDKINSVVDYVIEAKAKGIKSKVKMPLKDGKKSLARFVELKKDELSTSKNNTGSLTVDMLDDILQKSILNNQQILYPSNLSLFPIVGKDKLPISDVTKLCNRGLFNVSLNCRFYSTQGNTGVTFYINALQLVAYESKNYLDDFEEIKDLPIEDDKLSSLNDFDDHANADESDIEIDV